MPEKKPTGDYYYRDHLIADQGTKGLVSSTVIVYDGAGACFICHDCENAERAVDAKIAAEQKGRTGA